MKNMSRRFACLVLALSLCLALLAGCGKDKGGAPDPTPEATKQTFDPAAYVRGGLDAVYLGEYSDEYLAMLGRETKDSCDERYERGMQVSLEVFCEYFGIDLAQCSDATRTELLDLMRRMYKCAKYEIGPTVQNGDGYTVSVTVSPIAAVAQAAQNDYPGFAQNAANPHCRRGAGQIVAELQGLVGKVDLRHGLGAPCFARIPRCADRQRDSCKKRWRRLRLCRHEPFVC